MDTGLGRDGYSIVGQGRIADMVSSKTGDRREMLEELREFPISVTGEQTLPKGSSRRRKILSDFVIF